MWRAVRRLLQENAGIVEQDAGMEELVVDRTLAIGEPGESDEWISIEPSTNFRVTYDHRLAGRIYGERRVDHPPRLGHRRHRDDPESPLPGADRGEEQDSRAVREQDDRDGRAAIQRG